MAVVRNLQAIGDDLEAIDAALSEVGGDVTGDVMLSEWFDRLTDESQDAVDGYLAWIDDLEVRAAAKRAKVRELEQAARMEEERAAMLERRLVAFLRRRGGTFRTCLTKLRVQRNGRRSLTWCVGPDDLPDEFREGRIVYTPRVEEIRRMLEAGEELPFAYLEEAGYHLRRG